MLVPMAKVRIVGHRRQLDATLAALHESGSVHLIDVAMDSGVRLPPLTVDEPHFREIEELRYTRARLDSLLRLLPEDSTAGGDQVTDVDVGALQRELDDAAPEVEDLVGRLDGLRREEDTLPRHLASLRRLLPLVPDMGGLQGYETAALLIDARYGAVLGELNARLTDELEGNFEIVSDRVDGRTIGAILIYPRRAATVVAREIGRGRVSRIRLPERYESVPLRTALVDMERRLAELPAAIEAASEAVASFVRAHPHWPAARRQIAARLEQLGAIRSLGATPHTFVISGWVPQRDFDDLVATLTAAVGSELLIEETPPEEGDEPPVLFENPAPARPFESFVKLLQIPRYGTLDPATLMLLFLPLFFGMMLGDVVYGVLVLGVGAILQRHFRMPGFPRDLARILLLCGGWTVVWGIIYGEYLGDLGHRLFGVEPIWINREEAIEPLLLFAIAVGGAHVTLGLLLGVWQAARLGNRRELGKRVGMLIALIGLFAIAGTAAGRLPGQLLTPATAVVVVGLVMLIAADGAMGLLMGPLEVVGTVGNVLSYLRIAAIGLASVYLARVANELGATAPLWLGVIVASLFHALNLVLGVFSPTIQSLRLHYVEFFGKFFEGGGESFEPFGAKPETPEPERRPTPQP